MGSPSRSTLDEVHCLWPLCSHTCCWEAEQRIHAGKPRMLKALTSCRASAPAADDDDFPAVTVVNAADWTDPCFPTEIFPLKSEQNVSEAASDALKSQVASPKGAKRHVTSPHLAVKNLIFLPSTEMNKCIAVKKKVKQDKARKRALSKQTSLKSPLNQEGKGSLKSEVDPDPSDPGRSWRGLCIDLRVKKVPAAPQCQTLVAALEAENEQQPPSSARTCRPRKKLMLLQPVCERMQRRHARDEHRTSKHKLDKKAGIDRIDWESLKRQSYRWRRLTKSADSHSSSVEDKADHVPENVPDHVPDSLHPDPIPNYQSKSPSTTGAAKCQNKANMNEIRQSWNQSQTSKHKVRPLRNDGFTLCSSTYRYWRTAQLTINADDESDMKLCIKGSSAPPHSKQSLLEVNPQHLSCLTDGPSELQQTNCRAASCPLPPPSSL